MRFYTHSFTQIQIFFFVRAAFYSKFISTYKQQLDLLHDDEQQQKQQQQRQQQQQ